VFISHWNCAITEKFRQRLKRVFSQFSLKSEDFCIILPRLEKSDYLQLNLIADIGLDTVQFTGFLTSLDSIACNLPIVTCEREFMRSRQTAGILKHIGVTDMITSNQREYINIAVKLGLNLYLRQQIVNKIQKKQSIIYENVNCIQALENFYRKQFSMNPS
jgi:predicted O-linked N-acetylglucosamine transferase (SPINDLY family)